MLLHAEHRDRRGHTLRVFEEQLAFPQASRMRSLARLSAGGSLPWTVSWRCLASWRACTTTWCCWWWRLEQPQAVSRTKALKALKRICDVGRVVMQKQCVESVWIFVIFDFYAF